MSNNKRPIPRCPFDGTLPSVLPSLDTEGPKLVKCKRHTCPLSKTSMRWEDWCQRSPHEMKVMDIAPDEPIFVLRATDTLAPQTVLHWIKQAAAHGGTPAERLQQAAEDEAAMYNYQRRKF